MMCDARLFAPQIDVLGTGRAVEIYELASADSVEALAGDVLAAAPPKFALGGLSMGGIVAMEVLRQAPERLAGLALMDTNPLAESDDVKIRRAPQMDKARTGQLETVMRDEMKPNYLSDGPRRGEILDLCMDMAMTLGPEVFCRQSVALMNRPDQTETLRRFTGLALVLCGQQDLLCPVERHELMVGLMPQSQLCVIDGAGHLPVLEQPDETTAALRRWLEEIDNG